MCGRPTIICQDPARQFDWEAGAPVRCHATTAVMQKQDRFNEKDNPQLHALSWPVYLKG